MRYRAGAASPGTSRERFERMLAAADYLAENLHEAPVWIVPCLEGAAPTRSAGSSIYPAVQNMVLAAGPRPRRDIDHPAPAVREGDGGALGLPPDVHSYALLPIGHPMGRFGPVGRAPLTNFVYENKWGKLCRDL
jgi:hypothetical protein